MLDWDRDCYISSIEDVRRGLFWESGLQSMSTLEREMMVLEARVELRRVGKFLPFL